MSEMTMPRRGFGKLAGGAIGMGWMNWWWPQKPKPSTSVIDDFNGAAGASPNPGLWNIFTADPIGQHWTNGEIGVYTNSPDNVRLDGQSHLVIEVHETPTGYTTGYLHTKGKLDTTYGRTEVRLKLPTGKGIWPTFWMLGSNVDTAGWPQCGEIDISEMVGSSTGDDTNWHITLHGPQSGNTNGYMLAWWPPNTLDVSENFHTCWVNRQANLIQVGVDAQTLVTYTPTSLPAGAQWVFEAPMYTILSVAVAGQPPGPPDAATVLPTAMLVDWFKYTP